MDLTKQQINSRTWSNRVGTGSKMWWGFQFNAIVRFGFNGRVKENLMNKNHSNGLIQTKKSGI